MTVEVLEPGPLISVQTPAGRPGWQRFGVRVGGAADPWSARMANRLVGSDDAAPLLEATGAGPTLRFDAAAVVALSGADWPAALDGVPLPVGQPRLARAGATLHVESGRGMRLYVAIRGLVAEEVLGSAATDLAAGFGGHHGRALRRGDRLPVVARPAAAGRARASPPRGGPIRVVPGPHAEWFTPRFLSDGAWRVAPEADRTGVRLDGQAATSRDRGYAEVPSMGLPLGAVQVPPDGRPILMLTDRPVTGGYPVPACVIAADVGLVAQLRPGDDARFVSVTEAEAVAALRDSEEMLATDAVDLSTPNDLGWVGAHE